MSKQKDSTTSRPPLRVETLGKFQVTLNDEAVPEKAWKRDKALQLLQFLICNREKHGLHREQIIDWLWPDSSVEQGQRDFKASLHGITSVLEKNRKRGAEFEFINRQGQSYSLNMDKIKIDVDEIGENIDLGNSAIEQQDLQKAAEHYKIVESLYQGVFLPNRIYDDWSATVRENTRTLALGAILELAEMKIIDNPLESIRYAQKALNIDRTAEEAYRILMRAHMEKGNRPQALKAYQNCVDVLDKEFGVEPLPETKKLYERCLK